MPPALQTFTCFNSRSASQQDFQNSREAQGIFCKGSCRGGCWDTEKSKCFGSFSFEIKYNFSTVKSCFLHSGCFLPEMRQLLCSFSGPTTTPLTCLEYALFLSLSTNQGFWMDTELLYWVKGTYPLDLVLFACLDNVNKKIMRATILNSWTEDKLNPRFNYATAVACLRRRICAIL